MNIKDRPCVLTHSISRLSCLILACLIVATLSGCDLFGSNGDSTSDADNGDNGDEPDIYGDLVVQVEGPEAMSVSMGATYYYQGSLAAIRSTSMNVPSGGGTTELDIEDLETDEITRDGLLVRITAPAGSRLTLTLLSDGDVLAEDDNPTTQGNNEEYAVEIGDVP